MSELSFVERSGVQVLEGFSSIAEAFSYLALRNVRVIEINLNNPYFLAQLTAAPERAEIAKVAQDEGISWVAHLPETMGFFDTAEQVFARYLMWLVRLQNQAAEAGCLALTTHIGAAPHFAYSGQRRQGADLFREYYETTLEVRMRRAANLLRNGPPVCIENVGGFHQQFVRDILSLIDGLSYTMDIGHLKVAHPRIADAEFDFFRKHIYAIRVVHVHDNQGEWDEHLPVTDPAALEPYLGFARESDAYLIMEIRPLEAALSSLAALSGIKR
jgi:sugar phosphate isomerase/epimerase